MLHHQTDHVDQTGFYSISQCCQLLSIERKLLAKCHYIYITFTFMHLADAFIQSDLHCIQVTVLHLTSSCFPWESNP